MFERGRSLLKGRGLGRSARRGLILASSLGLAAAIVGVGGFIPSRPVAGVGLALLAGGATLRIVGGVREEDEADRRRNLERREQVLIPVTRVGDVDPTRIGVDPAPPQEVLGGGETPDYVAREVDEELDSAVSKAISDSARGIVIAVGGSKVGKSRSLFEALRRLDLKQEVRLIAPADLRGLKALLADEESRNPGMGNALWLDDIEPFVEQGLTMATLELWLERFGQCVVAGTYGGKGSARVGRSIRSGAGDILRRANEVHLTKTNAEEIDPIRPAVAEETLELIERHGLAAYLVAGPELVRKLSTARHREGGAECPAGVSIVQAAGDWARAGRTDPMPETTLWEIWQEHSERTIASGRDAFEAGLVWALAPVAGSIALLERVGTGGLASYRAYDLVVGLPQARSAPRADGETIWRWALADASDLQALSVGVTASEDGRFEDALAGFEIALDTDVDLIACEALFNKGVALGRLGYRQEEMDAYTEIPRRFGGREDPDLVELVAAALQCTAEVFEEMGHHAQAVEAYEKAIRRYGELEEADLPSSVASALLGIGVIFARTGKRRAAIESYAEVVRRFGCSGARELVEPVARAFLNTGFALVELDRHEEAIEAFGQALGQIGHTGEGEFPELIACALLWRGAALAGSGRQREAVMAYEEVIGSFKGSRQPDVRTMLASAFIGKAAAFEILGRHQESIEVHAEVLRLFEESEGPGLRGSIASALHRRGIAFILLKRYAEAIEAGAEAADRFGNSDEKEVSGVVTAALLNKGVALGKLWRHEEALEAYAEVLRRLGESKGPRTGGPTSPTSVDQAEAVGRLGPVGEAKKGAIKGLDETDRSDLLVKALLGRAAAVGELGRNQEALDTYTEILRRFGDLEETRMRQILAESSVNRAVALALLGRPEEAVDEVMRSADLEGGVDDPELREIVIAGQMILAATLGDLGRHEEAVDIYAELVRHLGKREADGDLRPVAEALLGKAVALGKLGDKERELTTYVEVDCLIGDSESPEMRRLLHSVAKALDGNGDLAG